MLLSIKLVNMINFRVLPLLIFSRNMYSKLLNLLFSFLSIAKKRNKKCLDS